MSIWLIVIVVAAFGIGFLYGGIFRIRQEERERNRR